MDSVLKAMQQDVKLKQCMSYAGHERGATEMAVKGSVNKSASDTEFEMQSELSLENAKLPYMLV